MKGYICPDCNAFINVDSEATLHEIVSCPCCGLELEIISLDPLLLQEVPLEGEDWGE